MKNIVEQNSSMTENSHKERYQYEINPTSKNTSHSILLNYVSEYSVVLDVGCACGDMGMALKKYKNCTIYGFEYDERLINIAQKLNCYEKLHKVNLNELLENDYSQYIGFFDYIICGDVLEHLYYPKEILSILKKFLKENGYFLISLPNISNALIKAEILTDNFIYTDAGLLDRTHVHFFTHKTIPQFLADNNLLIEKFICTFNIIEFDNINPYLKINSSVRKYIFSKNNSYVYQYVMKIKHDNSISVNQCFIKNNILDRIGDNEILDIYKKQFLIGYKFYNNKKSCFSSIKHNGLLKTYKKIISYVKKNHKTLLLLLFSNGIIN